MNVRKLALAAQENRPDGRIDDGVFRPFMVECPNCEGSGEVACDFAELGYDHDCGGGGKQCPDCKGSGKVRNPALEWGRRCREFGQLWWTNTDHKGVRICTNPSGQVHKLCDWVALGLAP